MGQTIDGGTGLPFRPPIREARASRGHRSSGGRGSWPGRNTLLRQELHGMLQPPLNLARCGASSGRSALPCRKGAGPALCELGPKSSKAIRRNTSAIADEAHGGLGCDAVCVGRTRAVGPLAGPSSA